MSKDLSDRLYKKTRKGFKKSLVKSIKIFLKKKPKTKNMLAKDIRDSQKIKNKN